jgi:hypothetical protein
VLSAFLTAGVGDLIPPLRSSWDRQGDALAVGDDPDTALHRARQGVSRFTVEIEPPSALAR